ncbi:hypothetical protein BN159_0858 [Streptomyces davaonensis JCM 4913]|uniref:Uncharacterized protein n=1 Tax=Streptomyces davaonensis (strain DSM 101723 / JCM 4913 / KCC S-0913 / 768) TaxID=1214101 RepID=K4QWB3_STRDJ|nr:hypothetical protein [Streptomyces davaonensis]CCK25237.1 hypothetical protein BN159_0858 [Streptomyces davaonensis JCM 4913]
MNDHDHDLSTWSLERLAALAEDGEWLESIRVVAQGHAYVDDQPEEVRRRWAALALSANRRMGGDALGARELHQDFTLRMWVIDTLGPHPDWSPNTLAHDTLDALTLTPTQAEALARDWRDRPIEVIRDLRRHKNLTAHLDRLLSHLGPGPTHDRLLPWTQIRRLLP